jgi:hypothetical protein
MTYHPLSPEELNSLEIPPVNFLIDEIVPEGALIEVVAREKTGKSLLLIDMLVSIALGEPFLDRAVTQGPAILIAMEDSVRDVRERVNLRIGGIANVPFYVLPADGSLPDVRFSLEESASLEGLMQMIADLGAVAVGIDNLRETHGLAENDSDEMAPLLRGVRQIAHETNCTVLLTHHESKGGESRGSTAIAAAFDQVISWKLNDPASQELAGQLQIKGRYGPRQTIGATFGEHGRWTTSYVSLTAATTRERIAAFLKDCGGWHDTASILDGLQDKSVNLKTIQNLITELHRSEDVVRRGAGRKGDPFEYAAIGTSRLFPDIPEAQSGRMTIVPGSPHTPMVGNRDESVDPFPSEIPSSEAFEALWDCAHCGATNYRRSECKSCGSPVGALEAAA